jgi:hypothetical protein
VLKWINKDKRSKEIHFPPDTPDLDPQEHVWEAGRNATTHNRHLTIIEQTMKDFVSYIESKMFDCKLCGLRPQASWQD